MKKVRKLSKRIRYNYLFIIQDRGLYSQFLDWKKSKKKISDMRLARAFVLHFDMLIPHFKFACYQIGHERPFDDWIHDDSVFERDDELF